MRAAAFVLALAAGAARPVLAQDPKAVLERDLRQFEAWLPGVWDNAEQAFFAEEAGAKGVRRTRAEVTADGDRRYTFRYFGADRTTPVETRQVALATDVAGGVLKMTSPGCEIRWRREGAQFAGEVQPGSCGARALTRFVLSGEDLWLGEARLRRARAWTCWMAVPREGKPDSWFSARDLKLDDQGGEVWVTTDDPTPRRIGYRLRQVRWPAGVNQDALTLYVLREGEARAPGYAWASPDATRIGVNLRWMQGSCSR